MRTERPITALIYRCPLPTLLVCHAALGGRGHVLDVLKEGAARGLERGSHPGSASGRQLLLGKVHRECALLCVNHDAVAVLEQADRTANLYRKTYENEQV